MKKNISLLIIITSIFLLFSCATTKDAKEPYKIEVSGTGVVKIKPDIAIFTISLQSVKPTTEEAAIDLKNMQANVIKILVANQVKEDDIVSSYLNFEQEYDYSEGKKTLIGQKALSSYNVKIRDLDSIGKVFDSLSKISTITLSNITLKAANEETFLQEARQKAIKQAIDIASLYAKELNTELSKALYVTENAGVNYYNYRNMPYQMAVKADYGMGAAELDYRHDDITLSSSVNVTFEIK